MLNLSSSNSADDDFDMYKIVNGLVKPTPRPTQNLLRDLHRRQCGPPKARNCIAAKRPLETFAEDSFIDKELFSERKCQVPSHARASFLMVFSPDGRKVASTHGNHNIYVSDLNTGKCITTLGGHPRTPWCITFHPTNSDIIASGCLGGQVRVWDLNGNSELWTAENQSVIASVAFHPLDRTLVIATYNELHFWDWSKPAPSICITTGNFREKVRFVAFDLLGHKLITGISNQDRQLNAQMTGARLVDDAVFGGGGGPPNTFRQANVRSAVAAASRVTVTSTTTTVAATTANTSWSTASPTTMRRSREVQHSRIASSTNVNSANRSTTSRLDSSSNSSSSRSSSSSSSGDSVEEVTAEPRHVYYTSLFQQYERLIHRYLEVFHRPTMVDRGTDAFDMTTGRRRSSRRPRRLSTSSLSPAARFPSGHSLARQLLLPARTSTILDAVTSSSAVLSMSDSSSSSSSTPVAGPSRALSPTTSTITTNNSPLRDVGTQTQHPRRVLVLNRAERAAQSRYSTAGGGTATATVTANSTRTSITSAGNATTSPPSGFRIRVVSRGSSRFSTRRMSPPTSTTSSTSTGLDPSSTSDTPVASTSGTKRKISTTEDCSAGAGGTNQGKQRAIDFGGVPMPSPSSSLNANVTNSSPMTLRSMIVGPTSSNSSVVRPVALLSETGTYSNSDTVNSISVGATTPVSLQSATIATSGRPCGVASTSSFMPAIRSTLQEARQASRLNRLLRMAALDRTPAVTTFSTTERNVFNRSDAAGLTESNSTTPTFTTSTTTTSNSNSYRFLYHPSGTSAASAAATSSSTSTSSGSVPRVLSLLSERFGAFRPPSRDYMLNRAVAIRDLLMSQQQRSSSISGAPPPPLTSSGGGVGDSGGGGTTATTNTINSMVTSIMNDLRSCLDNIRGIRVGTHPHPTDILTAFSRMLNDSLHQSDELIRSLGTTIDELRTNLLEIDDDVERTRGRALLRAANFYVRDHTNALSSPLSLTPPPQPPQNSNHFEDPYSYAVNAEQRANEVRLRHCQTMYSQARRLRTQVEMVECLDRAQFEVQQLQMIRQMFDACAAGFASTLRVRRHIGSLRITRSMTTATNHARRTLRVVDQQHASTSLQANRADRSTTTEETVDDDDDGDNNVEEEDGEQVGLARFSKRSRTTETSSSHCVTTRSGTQVDHTDREDPPSTLQNTHVARNHQAVPNFSRSDSPQIEILTSLVHRLEQLILEHSCTLALIYRQQVTTMPSSNTNSPSATRSANTTDRSEQCLARHLLDCAARLNCYATTTPPADSTVAHLLQPAERLVTLTVSVDGAERHAARHMLMLTVQTLIRYIENDSTARSGDSLRMAVHLTVNIGRLLTDLLLLQVLEQLPQSMAVSSTSTPLNSARTRLTEGIEHICDLLLEHHSTTDNGVNVMSAAFVVEVVRRIGEAASHENWWSVVAVADEPDMFAAPDAAHLREQYRANVVRWRHQDDADSRQRERLSSVAASRHTRARQLFSGGGGQDRDQQRMMMMMRSSSRSGAGGLRMAPTYQQVANLVAARRSMGQLYRSANVDLLTAISNSGGGDGGEDGTGSNSAPLRMRRSAWNIPTVQVNSVPVRDVDLEVVEGGNGTVNDLELRQQQRSAQHLLVQRQLARLRRASERNLTMANQVYSRFLHPMYVGGGAAAQEAGGGGDGGGLGLFNNNNNNDQDWDETREMHYYDCERYSLGLLNHRIQVWDVSRGAVPTIDNASKNVIVNECKIHNDASVDISKDSSILVTLLPSGDYLNVTNRLGVYSLQWETLGQCLYTTTFELNAVSVSLSPLNRHLMVGLATKRLPVYTSMENRWTIGRIFQLDTTNNQASTNRKAEKESAANNKSSVRQLQMVRELWKTRETRWLNFHSVNCLRWLPGAGQGVAYATNTGQLFILS